MAPTTINVLLTSFPGLNLPKTLALPVPSTTSVSELCYQLAERIPAFNDQLILTTASNRQLELLSCEQISTLVTTNYDDFLSLRLSARMCGGKGGFGSQLRAAGGRMSSKRKRNQGENNGSSRNLDGRRLRTVTEAKALAEYLAIKPDMDKKDKEQRRKRWEQVVELAERRDEEIKTGSKGKVDGKWVEDKEEAGERTREAVLTAIKSGNYKHNNLSRPNSMAYNTSSDDSPESSGTMVTALDARESSPLSGSVQQKLATRSFFGFDEDDEFMSNDENDNTDKDVDDASEDGDMESIQEISTSIPKVKNGKAKTRREVIEDAAIKTRTRTKRKA